MGNRLLRPDVIVSVVLAIVAVIALTFTEEILFDVLIFGALLLIAFFAGRAFRSGEEPPDAE